MSSFLNFDVEYALTRWETCGPEISRIVHEFEDEIKHDHYFHAPGSNCHHDDNEKLSKNFKKDVQTVF